MSACLFVWIHLEDFRASIDADAAAAAAAAANEVTQKASSLLQQLSRLVAP